MTDSPSAAGAGAADRLTALPMDILSYIACFLPYREVVRLSVLSRSWRQFHAQYYPWVIDIDLGDFVRSRPPAAVTGDNMRPLTGSVDTNALRTVYNALSHQVSQVRVFELRVRYAALDERQRTWADLLVSLADAPTLFLAVPFYGYELRDPANLWTVALPPASTDLKLQSSVRSLPFTISGPGAAVLRKLRVDQALLREWPLLPSLSSLMLSGVRVTTPFQPGDQYPLLEELIIKSAIMDYGGGVNIQLPLLKVLYLEKVVIWTTGIPVHAHAQAHNFARASDLVIFAPTLEHLVVQDVDISGLAAHHLGADPFRGTVAVYSPSLHTLIISASHGSRRTYSRLSVFAPCLRHMTWREQCTIDLDAQIGRPRDGTIIFSVDGTRRPLDACKEDLERILHLLVDDMSPLKLSKLLQITIHLEKKRGTILSCSLTLSRLVSGMVAVARLFGHRP